MLRNRKAQAVLELAILGSLLILAFSIAITEGERYNRKQSYMHQTFRRNLKMANKDNRPTSLSTMDFRRASNMVNPMELGALQQFQDSNSILWSDGKKEKATNDYPKAKSWYLFNRDHLYEVDNTPPAAGSSAMLTYTVDTTPRNTTTLDRDESWGSLSSTKNMQAADTLHATTPTASDTSYLSAGGYYRGDGSDVTRSKEMH